METFPVQSGERRVQRRPARGAGLEGWSWLGGRFWAGCAWLWSILNKDVAVECLVGETPASATESASALLRRDKTVALPETEQHTATFIFKMLQGHRIGRAAGWRGLMRI